MTDSEAVPDNWSKTMPSKTLRREIAKQQLISLLTLSMMNISIGHPKNSFLPSITAISGVVYVGNETIDHGMQIAISYHLQVTGTTTSLMAHF